MTLPDPPLVDAAPSVDTRETRSLSFAPSDGPRVQFGSREPVPVGPGRNASPPAAFLIGGDIVHEFPIQATKVQRPPLRRETLKRDRLLAWLRVKIHHRVLLVTAEAGYGKTTLLADFDRHHRRPTMWYRLDEEDRNWVSFLNYLIAAGREVQPGFAPATKELLGQLGDATGPGRDAIVGTFARELRSLGDGGAVLVIDDFHLVDDVGDVQVVVRELIARAPERLTLVFVSRRPPALQLARMRTLGEVAELTASDLRFDLDETDRLFRDTYGRPLEPDVLADLADRTEGWAASLQLVHTALRDRDASETRAFIHALTGAHGELYDYLAEEVVGELDAETQLFLMRTSILQSVDQTLGHVVSGFTPVRARELISAAERLGLLSRKGRGGDPGARYHPLVRDFLDARLRRAEGDEGVRELHRAVARSVGFEDWRLAAYHLAAAEDMTDLGVIVQAAIAKIMGSGEFALAEAYAERAASEHNGAFELLRSRMELHRGHLDRALRFAEAAVDSAMRSEDDQLADHALLNLIAVLHITGSLEAARDVAELLAGRTSSPMLRSIAESILAVSSGSLDGNVDEIRATLLDLAAEQERSGLGHYVGITWLNIADIDCARGDSAGALAASTRAIEALSATSAGIEVEGARVLRGWALAYAGRWDEADQEFALALASQFEVQRPATMIEIAGVCAALGDRPRAEMLIAQALESPYVSSTIEDFVHLTLAELAARRLDVHSARGELSKVAAERPHPAVGFRARYLVARAFATSIDEPSNSGTDAAAAIHLASRQGARAHLECARILQAANGTPGEFDRIVEVATKEAPAAITTIAEAVVARLDRLQPATLEAVADVADNWPRRWREPLRMALDQGVEVTRFLAASILNRVGEASDVPLLRRSSKQLRGYPGAGSLGRGLARRLAPRVTVEDQGRVLIRIGSELVPGTTVRRRALAVLCFLLTRPNMSATRDQVLDAIWPDLEPDVGGNSLNQTVYFLRRVFEPNFNEDLSPGYVHHDSDILWLDPELVTSRSMVARAAIRLAERDPSPENVEALSQIYLGRFALDFAYEEWAGPYRDSMHAAYLEIIERAVLADTGAGAFDRAIGLARRALEVDPDAEEVELSLLRLYRRTGAHAAAAEQYAHYAAVMRSDLGIEPPPLESL